MKLRKLIALSLMLLCSMGLVAGCGTKETPVAVAEKYPDKAITIIIPRAAGGSNDMMIRAMEKLFAKHMGQNLIVKNLPGGAGAAGWNELAGSNADGYTLGSVASSVLLQPLYGETRYHYPSALDPLVQVMNVPIVAVVRSDQQWDNMEDVVSYAKQHSGEIKYSHGGLGAVTHIIGEMVANEAGIILTQVPFKGESEALAALLGGHVQLIFTTPPSVKDFVKSNKVKVLGVSATQRMSDPAFSNIPTFQEQGLNVKLGVWYGIAAPKTLPVEVKNKLLDGLKKVINDPEYIENMKKFGMEVEYLGHEEFFQKWLKETRKLTKVVKESGIAEKIAEQKK